MHGNCQNLCLTPETESKGSLGFSLHTCLIFTLNVLVASSQSP